MVLWSGCLFIVVRKSLYQLTLWAVSGGDSDHIRPSNGLYRGVKRAVLYGGRRADGLQYARNGLFGWRQRA